MKLSKTNPVLMVLLALVVSLAGTATAFAQEVIDFDVALAGGTANVSATVHENPDALPWGATVLAVHGFTETAAVWGPMTEALFEHRATRRQIKRVIALDLPGHGNSEPPTTLGAETLFGDLSIFDNVSVVIQAIDILRAQGMGPRVIMGHSMGGLAVQGVQEALLASGSSLADHGVYKAVLLAPVPALSAEWTQPPPSDLTPFVAMSPTLGTYLDLPPQVAIIGGGFTTTAGTLVSGTPSVAEMASYVGLEPIVTALQLVGSIPLPRPDCRQGAFSLRNGTLLTVVSFSEDVLTPAVDQDDLYRHLIGRRGLLYRAVEGPEAVHSMYITDPEGMLDQMYGLPFMF